MITIILIIFIKYNCTVSMLYANIINYTSVMYMVQLCSSYSRLYSFIPISLSKKCIHVWTINLTIIRKIINIYYFLLRLRFSPPGKHPNSRWADSPLNILRAVFFLHTFLYFIIMLCELYIYMIILSLVKMYLIRQNIRKFYPITLPKFL